MNYKVKAHILKYLDRYYYTKENRIFKKEDDIQEWGLEVTDWVSKIFSQNIDKCSSLVIEWVESKGVLPSEVYNLWGARALNCTWSLELADDLKRLGVSNVQERINDIVIENLSKEIDTTILKELKEHIKTRDELVSLIKCIGYEISPVIYDPTTFKPLNKFISVKYHEILNERQNNNIWQNNFRPTRTDEQTQVTS